MGTPDRPGLLEPETLVPESMLQWGDGLDVAVEVVDVDVDWEVVEEEVEVRVVVVDEDDD